MNKGIGRLAAVLPTEKELNVGLVAVDGLAGHANGGHPRDHRGTPPRRRPDPTEPELLATLTTVLSRVEDGCTETGS